MTPTDGWVWVPPAARPPLSSVGGKATQLDALALLAHRFGATVPRFVVLRTEAFVQFGADAADEGMLPDLADDIQLALSAAGLSDAMLAVRSSATAEDGTVASFAGQFDTILGVAAADRMALHNAIRRVWLSVKEAHAVAYSNQQGEVEGSGVQMAVIMQEMVEPFAAGVAFALDPVSGARDTAVVSAVPGLGEGLVSGELDADTWHVSSEGRSIRFSASVKTHAVRMQSGGGTIREELDASQAQAPVLNDNEVRRIAEVVRGVSEAQGAPQDMEWAMLRGDVEAPTQLVLLQTRPVTTLRTSSVADGQELRVSPPPSHDPRGAGRRVWDNSNIIESYAGVTTPLTFTFARSVYEDVYRQFCALMGVSPQHMADSESAFSHMLGLVRGRVYYSLINWYRLIALLPGFEWNRAFMERMMGVREALEAPPAPPGSGNRLRDFVRLIGMLVRMIREQSKLTETVPEFHARVARTLEPLRGVDLSTWDAPHIAALYRRLEQELLHHWRPPLVNDFFAMIHFGVLGRLITRWLPDAPRTLCNDLLCGEGGIISTQPARRVMALARMVRESPALREIFAQEADDDALWHQINTRDETKELAALLHEYIEAFGDRCLEELKLETLTLREDATFLIRMVKAYVDQGAIDPDAALAHEKRLRANAESVVTAQLTGWREAIFMWVLSNTRARVRDRENLRFERTRVFGMVRRMVLGLGDAFTRSGHLQHPRDIFWLSIEEILAVAEGGGKQPGDGLNHLASERKAQFAQWERDVAPPDRFETTGPLGDWAGPREAEIPRPALTAAHEGDLSGTGCCPGVIRARVCIVRDPREAGALTRDGGRRILVAERTDPGWTLLFPAAAGLLVQRGSLLSHSAIVAREMALPCIVGIAGLLDTLVEDELVEMDGTTGIVRRHIEVVS